MLFRRSGFYDEYIVIPNDFILGMLFSMTFPRWPIVLVAFFLILGFGGMITQLGFVISYLFLLFIVGMNCIVCIKRCRSRLPTWIKVLSILFALTVPLALPSVYLLCGGSLYSSRSNVYLIVWIYLGMLLISDSFVHFMLKAKHPIWRSIAAMIMLGVITFLLFGTVWALSFYQEYSRYVSASYQHMFSPFIRHTEALYKNVDFLGCRSYVNHRPHNY